MGVFTCVQVLFRYEQVRQLARPDIRAYELSRAVGLFRGGIEDACGEARDFEVFHLRVHSGDTRRGIFGPEFDMVFVLDAADKQRPDYLRRRAFARDIYHIEDIFADKIRQVFAAQVKNTLEKNKYI